MTDETKTEAPAEAAPAEVAVEEVVTSTSDLKFVGGKLHQRVIVTKDGAAVPEWREVPGE